MYQIILLIVLSIVAVFVWVVESLFQLAMFVLSLIVALIVLMGEFLVFIFGGNKP